MTAIVKKQMANISRQINTCKINALVAPMPLSDYNIIINDIRDVYDAAKADGDTKLMSQIKNIWRVAKDIRHE